MFENGRGGADAKSSEQISALVRDYDVPIIVLNASRSAMLDGGARDSFASAAASLITGRISAGRTRVEARMIEILRMG